jgi:lipopolysaccharide biosynthesis regulator YciM
METIFSFQFWFIVLILIALFSVLYIYYFKRRDGRKDEKSYLEALKYMTEGESRRAIEKFKESIRYDSSNVDAYIKLGMILRNEGLYNNVIRILKDLLLRADIREDDLIEIKRNLALTYWQAKNYEKAETYFNELIEKKNLYDWAALYLIKICEMKKEWEKASNLLKESTMAKSEQGKSKLALYKILQGEEIVQNGDEKTARICFKDALKFNPKCSAAYLYLGDSYLRENRLNDALEKWTDLCKKIPDKAYLAFERLEKALYETGKFSKIEELYHSILEEDEENINAIIALSEIYRKKGEYNEALKLLQNSLKKDIDTKIINSLIVKILYDRGQFKESAKQAIDLIEKDNLPEYKRFPCDKCKSVFFEPFWICPKCGEWNLKIL